MSVIVPSPIQQMAISTTSLVIMQYLDRMVQSGLAAPAVGNLRNGKVRRCHKAFLVDWVAQVGSFQVRSVARHGIIVRPHSGNPAASSAGENCGR